jgi:4-phytase/acid phosphatase
MLATFLGAYYRSAYARAGLLDASECGASGTVSVSAGSDPAARATAQNLLAGMLPGCNLASIGITSDAALDLPSTSGSQDATASAAAVDPAENSASYREALARLDALLDCGSSVCKPVSNLPPATALGVAGAAADDLRLEYAGALPGESVGWGHLDLATLRELAQLGVARQKVEARNPDSARPIAGGLASQLIETLNSASGAAQSKRLVALVGHAQHLGALSGLLHLGWSAPGYWADDTPPGSALVFELYGADPHVRHSSPSVRVFFVAQPLEAMRSATPAWSSVPVVRVPVTIAGCPDAACPLGTLDAIVTAAVPAARGSQRAPLQR